MIINYIIEKIINRLINDGLMFIDIVLKAVASFHPSCLYFKLCGREPNRCHIAA